MSPGEKANSVDKFLTALGFNMGTILQAIDLSVLDKSYEVIKNNPNITKEEFLEQTGIEEFEYL